jgi:FkbM family methyltransferase
MIYKNYKKQLIKYFSSLALEVGFTIIDVGARKDKARSNPTIKRDFNFIAKGCNYVGYEPDSEEFKKLKKNNNQFWNTQNFLPDALGEKEGVFNLNVYNQPGLSSKFKAKKDQFSLFSRSSYLGDLNKSIPVKVTTLDNSIKKNRISNPSFLKIDVQGMELEVFKGAKDFLQNQCLGIRVEVAFHQVYENQPLFFEVDSFLREFGFFPFEFAELHSWRRDSIKKYPFTDPHTKINFSKGQLMHGDIIYLKTPLSLPKNNINNQKIRLALIAICYQHFDIAHYIFRSLKLIDINFEETVAKCEKFARIQSKAYFFDRSFHRLKKILNRLY